MKILPFISSLVLLLSCSPKQQPVPVFISSPDKLVPVSDSLMSWYSNWSGKQTHNLITISSEGGVSIRIGSEKPDYRELIGWIQTDSDSRLPLEIASSSRSDLAFFKTNFIRNRLIALGWTLPEDPVYQITID